MATMEKVAVTLPKTDIQRLRKMEHELGDTFSGIVRRAVEAWLRELEILRVRALYQEYYRQPSARQTERALAGMMSRASSKSWPID